MAIVLDLIGLAAFGLVVWVLFRAARARPDERGLRYVAWGSLVAFVLFSVLVLVDFGYVYENAGSLGQNAVLLGILAVVVLGYREIVRRLRDQADRNS